MLNNLQCTIFQAQKSPLSGGLCLLEAKGVVENL